MNLLVITNLLNSLLMIAIPISLGIILINKFHFGWKVWGIGACIFIISQIFHLPFNQFVLNPYLIKVGQAFQGTSGSLVIAASGGLSAGIFEETARYFMYRWWLKDSRTWRSGILAGAGHGGIEAILLGILVLVGYVNMMAYRNLDLSRLNLTLDQLSLLRQQLQAYWSLPWYVTLLGAVERVFAIAIHIAASVIVLQVFTRRQGKQQLGWLGLAILYHAFVDACALFTYQKWGAYVTEATAGVLALVAVVIIFALRQPQPTPAAVIPEVTESKPRPFIPTPMEETSENLEKTRYQ